MMIPVFPAMSPMYNEDYLCSHNIIRITIHWRGRFIRLTAHSPEGLSTLLIWKEGRWIK